MHANARTGMWMMMVGLTLASAGEARADAFTEVVKAALADYRTIHRHPEIGHQELKTAQLVRDRLTASGFNAFVDIAELTTEVIAVLDTRKSGPTLCFRADMDARPLPEGQSEETGLPYASEIPGFMHNCGHDFHTAALLGAARLLSKDKTLRGRIVFIFQPAEEIKGGADDVVASGVLKELQVQAMFGLHVANDLPVGTYSTAAGPIMAGSNYFKVEVTGRGAHAATPHLSDDVLLAACEMVAAVSNLPARKLDVLRFPTVVTVAHINAGTAKTSNAIPSEALFKGTVRSFTSIDAPVHRGKSFRALFGRTISALAQKHGVQADVSLRAASPPTINHQTLYEKVVPELQACLAPAPFEPTPRGMFAEDFSYYTSEVPCLYFSVGVADDASPSGRLHTNTFKIAEDAMAHAVRFWVELASVASANVRSDG